MNGTVVTANAATIPGGTDSDAAPRRPPIVTSVSPRARSARAAAKAGWAGGKTARGALPPEVLSRARGA
ncbi:hypothetical protein GCM10022402_14300 [Salinactinospora qingdaonensis]|uniref:Uncharacterized protein n=1 Tax=Salinactinospora qingdaonensis TaxID=702744 RepID=A0ABP7FB19_9ACTN